MSIRQRFLALALAGLCVLALQAAAARATFLGGLLSGGGGGSWGMGGCPGNCGPSMYGPSYGPAMYGPSYGAPAYGSSRSAPVTYGYQPYGQPVPATGYVTPSYPGTPVYYPPAQSSVVSPVVVSQPTVTTSSQVVTTSTQAKSASSSPRIHALLVFDTRDGQIGNVLRKDLVDVRNWFTAQLDPSQIAGEQPKVLSGASATAEEVLEFCNTVDPGPQDTVFVYIGSHGEAYDDDDHAVILGHKRLPRSRIMSLLQKKSPRLTVLITDSCFGGLPAAGVGAGPAPGARPEAKYKRLMDDLFIQAKGVVNINSCAPGELAWNGRGGGLMTQALIDVFQKGRQGFGKDDERVTWPEMVDAIQEEVDRKYSELKRHMDPAERGAEALERQTSQTLYQFANLPGAVASRSPRKPAPARTAAVETRPATDTRAAFLEVELPAGVTLFLDGKPIPSGDSGQVYVKLPASGKAATCTLTAQRVVNGQRQTVAQFVEAAPGQTTRVSIEFPPAR